MRISDWSSDVCSSDLFLSNRDRLLGFLRAHGAGEDSEDLLQALWIKVSAAPSGPIAQPLSYLYCAATNLMLDRYRSKQGRKSAESGKSVSVRVDLGGGGIIKKKKTIIRTKNTT